MSMAKLDSDVVIITILGVNSTAKRKFLCNIGVNFVQSYMELFHVVFSTT